MAELALPLRADVPAFRYAVDLEGRTYGFAFAWNPRSEGGGLWHMDVLTAAGAVLLAGLPLVADFPLLQSYRSIAGLPPGELFVVDLAGKGEPPTRDTLGTRHAVLYYDTTALAALAATRSTT